MCCKCYHIIFSTFSLKFTCKISVQKEEIRNFKYHILVTQRAKKVVSDHPGIVDFAIELVNSVLNCRDGQVL